MGQPDSYPARSEDIIASGSMYARLAQSAQREEDAVGTITVAGSSLSSDATVTEGRCTAHVGASSRRGKRLACTSDPRS